MPPPPPVPPPPNGPQTRSLSLGAIAPSSADVTAVSGTVSRRDEDKRRRESEARQADVKKRKEAEATPPIPKTSVKSVQAADGEETNIKKKVSQDDSNEKLDKKKIIKKKDESPMDVDEKMIDKKVPKSRAESLEKISPDPVERKKSVKTRDTSSASRDLEKKKVLKEGVTDKPSKDKQNVSNSEAAVRTPTPENTETDKVCSRASKPSTVRSSSNKSVISAVRSPSNKSVISAVSTDGTLRASDSSICTRHSVSPTKSVIEVDSVTSQGKTKLSTSQLPYVKPSGDTKLSKNTSSTKVAKTNSAAKVYKASSGAKVSKNTSTSKIDPQITNGSNAIIPASETSQDKTVNESPDIGDVSVSKIQNSEAVPPAADSASSKDSSQHSSVVSTPARSRTGSESSTDARPGRQDSSRRNSKIFSKAAMWDNMCMQQQTEKPPLAVDKVRKNSRPGGLNLSDITKKFEDKPPADRKKPVVGAFKVSS